MRTRVVAAGGVLALVVACISVVAVAAGGGSTASCTPAPVVTEADAGSEFSVTCTVPRPAAATETVSVPGPTVTVTATPTSSPTPTSTPTPSTPPSSTPTVTPTPTVPPTTGWPDAANTGVPDGVTLKASGSVTVTQAGAVIDGLDISGSLTINAANVSVKNTRIRSSAFWAVTVKGANTTIVDSEVDGLGGTEGNSGVVSSGGGTFTLTRVDIKGNENPVVPGSNTTIEDSWLHGLKAPGSPHYDGVQIDGGVSNITIRHNTIENTNTQTSAVMVDNFGGQALNVTVIGNLLTGGGYTIYYDGNFSSSIDRKVTGSVTNNVIGKGYYGYALIRGSNTTVTWSGNTDATTGRTITKP